MVVTVATAIYAKHAKGPFNNLSPRHSQATFLFSSESYIKTKHVYEQLADSVVRVAFVDLEDKKKTTF